MKVGPLEITVATVAYSAGAVAALIVLTMVWRKNSEVRYEAWYRGTILRAMNGDSPESGMSACETLIGMRPLKANAKLFLANLQFRAGQFKEAEQAFADAAATPTCTAQEKAWALVGRGVSLVAAAGKADPAKAQSQAEVFFQEALKEDKDCTDALIALGVLAARKNDAEGLAKAESYVKQALAASSPASLAAQEQLYVLAGVCAMRQERPQDADAFFERARTVHPAWKDAETVNRGALLASALQKDVEPARRAEILQKCGGEVSRFGKDQTTAINAIGVGWSMLKGTALAEKGYGLALNTFGKAMESDSKDPRAYRNMAGIKEDRILEWAAKAPTVEKALTGDPPVNDKWRGGEKQVARFQPSDQLPRQEINKLLKDLETMWQKFYEKSAKNNAEKAEARLWQISCLRRTMYLFEIGEETQRAGLLGRALKLADDLTLVASDNPQAHFAAGQVKFEKGDYGGALEAFKQAQAKGMTGPAIERLVKFLGSKTEVMDVRPPKERRWFGPRPLIGGTVKAPTSQGVPKKVTMKVAEKAVEPTMVGSQILYVPGPSDVLDGDLQVTVAVTDTVGRTTEFPPFGFSLDRKPPTWTVAPDTGTIPTKTVFTITLADRSGIDFGSVKVVLKRAKGGTDKILIGGGQYKIDMKDVNPQRTRGFPLDSETFQVSSGDKEMAPGEWELSVSVQDTAGNVLTDAKKYTVK